MNLNRLLWLAAAGEEEMDFNIHVLKRIQIGNLEFAFTNSLWYAMWICIFLIIFAVIVHFKLKKVDPLKPPKGFMNLLEMAVEFLHKNTIDTMGKQNAGFTSFYGCFMFYILICNLAGMLVWFVPNGTGGITIRFMRPPPAALAVTLSMALITFFMTQGFAIKAKGVKGWLKALTEPVALLTPINLIGEVANPVSLSFRLMGNLLAGTIIMGLIYALLPYIAYVFTPPLHFYFDLFAGVLQSYIFVMLSMIYVSGAME